MLRPSSKLDDLHVEFRAAATKLFSIAKESGLDPVVIQTLRPREYQQWLWEQGRTRPGKKVTWARPGQSAHEYGMAIDIAPRSVLKLPNWAPQDPIWNALGQIGLSLGLSWGVMKRAGRTDLNHFEHPEWRQITGVKR